MKRFLRQINCQDHYEESRRSSPFFIIKYELNYESDEFDRTLIDGLFEKAHVLASRVNPQPANAEKEIRLPDTLLANAIAGVVSEFLWLDFLNSDPQNPIVRDTPFTDASTQIDLEVINGGKMIEVRSSFPRNGLVFAICDPEHQFDILGPYANSTYKPGEIQKQFYVRTLFVVEKPTDIIESIKKDGFEAFLTGGATEKMMRSPKFSLVKSLRPEDALRMAGQARYKVVPFSRALDTIQIQALIQQASSIK